jgi:hypothetical protein
MWSFWKSGSEDTPKTSEEGTSFKEAMVAPSESFESAEVRCALGTSVGPVYVLNFLASGEDRRRRRYVKGESQTRKESDGVLRYDKGRAC